MLLKIVFVQYFNKSENLKVSGPRIYIVRTPLGEYTTGRVDGTAPVAKGGS